MVCFPIFFVKDLQSTVTQFGLAIGIQMLMWGMFAPIFGAMADKIGGNKVTIIAFLFMALGIYLLYSGPNTGIFFHIHLGLLVGIGLGGTAISVQIGEVAKHFPNKTRGLAIGIVVAMASIGYFFSPMYTKFALSAFGWEKTLETFLYFIVFGMIAGIFLFPVKKEKITTANIKLNEQTIREALKEAFNHKGFLLLTFGFFVCGFNITLVSAHIPGYIQERGFAFSNGTNSDAKVVLPEPGKPMISIFFINCYIVASLGRGLSSIGKWTTVAKKDNAIDKYQA